jgi:predicted RNase H-like HicB family nuclease
MASELFSAVLEPAKGGGFGVYFPNFPGCVSFGDTAKEAQANAAEALALHIEGMVEDGEEIPYEGADDEPVLHASNGVGGNLRPIFVQVDLPEGSERVNVYLPKRLISTVDRFASASGMNRSSVFGLAVKRLLKAELGVDITNGPDLRERLIAAMREAEPTPAVPVGPKRSAPGSLLKKR